ncbi:HTH-type transcriptional regulator BetI [Mycobacterium marinum]|uniref:HTH-type transcriptional regulator BetI n=1 Tax=Mycobacterium marinum TaxID=1781 RepID=A0A3E2MQ35_MYCMR|nr:HTH-type transcriptional regulator BetI [Mycobacterium marinum]
MCSADLTAKARIRNAAVARFARDGFQKVNLRAIATSAGVSEALIFHHFGSKDVRGSRLVVQSLCGLWLVGRGPL